jgi:hypothetical protein
MKLTRRSVLAKLSAAALALSVGIITPVLSGCNQNEVAALIQVVGGSVASIASIQGNSALADQLNTDFGAAQSAVTGWKQGSAVDSVVQALSLVQKDLNLFPVDAQTKVYISLAITTVNSILAIVSPAQSGGLKAARATKPLVNAKEYKKQWNALLVAHPTPKVAPLK